MGELTVAQFSSGVCDGGEGDAGSAAVAVAVAAPSSEAPVVVPVAAAADGWPWWRWWWWWWWWWWCASTSSGAIVAASGSGGGARTFRKRRRTSRYASRPIVARSCGGGRYFLVVKTPSPYVSIVARSCVELRRGAGTHAAQVDTGVLRPAGWLMR